MAALTPVHTEPDGASLEDSSESDPALEERIATASGRGLRRWRHRLQSHRAWVAGIAGTGLFALALLAVEVMGRSSGQPGLRVPGAGSHMVADEFSIKDSEKCKASAKWCDHREVSLFCFSQIVSGGPEEELIKLQLKKGVSIFACDDFTVTCAEKRLLGTDKEGNEVSTLVNSETGKAKMGDTSTGATTTSFLNVLIFMKAWELVIKSGKVWLHDWTVKVDPDAVFFPNRLRQHLKPHTGNGEPQYTLNCREKHWKQDDVQGNGHFYIIPKLYGAIEVFNLQAIGAYKDCHKDCLKALEWKKWGEDMYMRKCMDMLKVGKVIDYEQVGDHRCKDNPQSECVDANRPAYHPHKTVSDWFKCYNDSMGIHWQPMDTSSGSGDNSGDESGGDEAGLKVAKPWGTCGGVGKPKMRCTSGHHCVKKSKWFSQCLEVEETI